MRIEDFGIDLDPVPGPAAAWHAEVDDAGWRRVCERARDGGGRLLALWASDRRRDGAGFAVHAALVVRSGLVCLTLPVQGHTYAGIADLFPAANRMQRAVADLMGLRAAGQPDTRPWLRHGAWPPDRFPLRGDADAATVYAQAPDDYAFTLVEGDGVHEVPVGPVHAGTIEPGHFRFSIVGERVLRLEERLGYTHKGIEKRFESMTLEQGARLAGRISGDSTVACAWAYAMAVEGMSGAAVPERALWLRALMLERERIANHLGDLGALGNDAGFAFGLAQFSSLKEQLLRSNAELFGHRYLMDAVVPGGVASNLERAGASRLFAALEELEASVARLRGIYDDHAGLQDRFMEAGRVAPELAARLGLIGLAGRASGQARDLRSDFPVPPYDRIGVRIATRQGGDVAARVAVRFDEVAEAIRICRLVLERMPDGPVSAPLPAGGPRNAFGAGWIEGWRGEIFLAIHADAAGGIRRVHPHDPSWQNWPLVEHAIIGNIVPDFPLINKSFNLSYSGHDL
ncbi:MAG TPA: NADH-quinone oxidoreductase subunit C [Burkholderiales bacterium]|nr:NADH-quinone oxidoreductase subunit C [Burkholderiales bacterium]